MTIEALLLLQGQTDGNGSETLIPAVPASSPTLTLPVKVSLSIPQNLLSGFVINCTVDQHDKSHTSSDDCPILLATVAEYLFN
jgi:hypothetical protein